MIPGVGARLSERWQLALPLVVPAIGGLVYLSVFGAPARLIAVNAGATALALVWVLLGRLPEAPKLRAGIALACTLGLFVPLLTGPDLGGVSRWLQLGPIALHSAALFLPLIVVLAADEKRWGPAFLATVAAALALQPDAQGLAALALACVPLTEATKRLAPWTIRIGAAVLAVLTFDAGTLAPQLYTEGVLAHVAQTSWPGAIALALLLLAWPLWRIAYGFTGAQPGAVALAALLLGFAIMAMLGPFPFPLIGYGASPILGFGLALGAVRRLPPGQESR